MTGPTPELRALPPRDPTEVTAELGPDPFLEDLEALPEEDTQILTLSVEDGYLGENEEEEPPPALSPQEEEERVSVQVALLRDQLAQGLELMHGGIEVLQRIDGLAQVGGKEHAHLMGAIRTVRAEQLEGLLRPGGLRQEITEAGQHWCLAWIEGLTKNRAVAVFAVAVIGGVISGTLNAALDAAPALARALVAAAGVWP